MRWRKGREDSKAVRERNVRTTGLRGGNSSGRERRIQVAFERDLIKTF